LEKRIESLLAHQKELEKHLQSMQQQQAAEVARSLKSKAQNLGSIRAVVENVGAGDPNYLQTVADSLKGQFDGVIVLGSNANGAVSLVAAVPAAFTSKIQAGKLIQQIAPLVGGKGGGRPDNARGGGKEIRRLDEALARARQLIEAACP
jgi:alanyl-tRNA synthetase